MALRYERQNMSQDFDGYTVFVDKQGLHTVVAEGVVLLTLALVRDSKQFTAGISVNLPCHLSPTTRWTR